MSLIRVVSVGFGRRLVRSGSVRFLGFVWWGSSAYALLSPWGGPGCLWVLLGCAGRPAPGVGPAAAAFCRRGVSGVPLC